MACVIGEFHTITLSDDGVVHSFGSNYSGQLGLSLDTEDNNQSFAFLPTPVSNIPKISQIACAYYFTVCVDEDGFMWTFGISTNKKIGQLGTGNTTNFNVPQKIQNVPPVVSVACGRDHILIITSDDNLWSCGNNEYGQLCLGNQRDRFIGQFRQTSFSNISKISLGGNHSLFQNIEGEIYACGCNKSGELGLGLLNSPQITPTIIPNLPSNIIQFVCGHHHSLFLDSEGNVFSVGSNFYGQLGLGHMTNQNELNQIPNIPPIQKISCVSSSSYLLDFEGNLWSFGINGNGQLGHGDFDIMSRNDEKINRRSPTKIESLKDIQQISYGPCGTHFFVKDSQNTIFAIGNNRSGQLGTKTDGKILTTPKEIDAKYFTIWGEVLKSKAKSARK